MKDNLAVLFSGLCIVHCLLTPLLLSIGFVGTLGTVITSEWVHTLLLVPVVLLAILSLPFSFFVHRSYCPMGLAAIGLAAMISTSFLPEHWELWLMVSASWLVISAHLWNKWLHRKLELGLMTGAVEHG